MASKKKQQKGIKSRVITVENLNNFFIYNLVSFVFGSLTLLLFYKIFSYWNINYNCCGFFGVVGMVVSVLLMVGTGFTSICGFVAAWLELLSENNRDGIFIYETKRK